MDAIRISASFDWIDWSGLLGLLARLWRPLALIGGGCTVAVYHAFRMELSSPPTDCHESRLPQTGQTHRVQRSPGPEFALDEPSQRAVQPFALP